LCPENHGGTQVSSNKIQAYYASLCPENHGGTQVSSKKLQAYYSSLCPENHGGTQVSSKKLQAYYASLSRERHGGTQIDEEKSPYRRSRKTPPSRESQTLSPERRDVTKPENIEDDYRDGTSRRRSPSRKRSSSRGRALSREMHGGTQIDEEKSPYRRSHKTPPSRESQTLSPERRDVTKPENIEDDYRDGTSRRRSPSRKRSSSRGRASSREKHDDGKHWYWGIRTRKRVPNDSHAVENEKTKKEPLPLQTHGAVAEAESAAPVDKSFVQGDLALSTLLLDATAVAAYILETMASAEATLGSNMRGMMTPESNAVLDIKLAQVGDQRACSEANRETVSEIPKADFEGVLANMKSSERPEALTETDNTREQRNNEKQLPIPARENTSEVATVKNDSASKKASKGWKFWKRKQKVSSGGDTIVDCEDLVAPKKEGSGEGKIEMQYADFQEAQRAQATGCDCGLNLLVQSLLIFI
jgi:hypothetical protein